jgi:hypothetical protein
MSRGHRLPDATAMSGRDRSWFSGELRTGEGAGRLGRNGGGVGGGLKLSQLEPSVRAGVASRGWRCCWRYSSSRAGGRARRLPDWLPIGDRLDRGASSLFMAIDECRCVGGSAAGA